MEFADSSFYNMFVASFCTEDDILSQWRGYGMFGSAYAIGFDIQKLIETIEKNNFQLRHCQYENRKDYTQIIKDYIPKIIESTIKNPLFVFDFVKTISILKLDCFKEEDEWRIISSKPIANSNENVNFRPGKNMIIPYYCLKFDDFSSIVSMRIGPSQQPNLAKESIHRLASRFEIKNLDLDNISNSEIPYRVF